MDDIDFKIGQLEIDDIDLGDMFDVESEDKSYKIVKNRYMKPKLFRNAKSVKYKRASDFAKEVSSDIFKGESIYAILAGNFIFGEIVEALLEQSPNEFIEELTISTLSMSIENVASLRNIIEMKQAKTINLIISDYFFAHNRENIKVIYEELDVDDNFQLAVAGSHTKIMLLKMKTGQKIVLHGSANLRSSSSLEQVMIETNEHLYDFNYEWHKAILDKYATINKSIRGNKLFETIKKG